MTQIPPVPRESRPPCGHGSAPFSNTRIDIRRLAESSPDNHVIRFLSLVGGDRTLAAQHCDSCRRITYTHRERGQQAEVIGDDPEVLTAALTAVLAQPDVDIFALTVDAHNQRSLIIPRHHLPVFTVERR